MSPGNHQAWIAISGIHSPADAKDFPSRLRKGVGADRSASGATRVAATPKYKRNHFPDFPAVRIGALSQGRIVTKERLEKMGLAADRKSTRLNSSHLGLSYAV